MVEDVGFESAAFLDEEVQKLDFTGEGTTVLAFFPGAFTGPCTEEMCALRDEMSKFEDLETKIIGISVDTPFALKEFAEQNDLNFPLVSDTDKSIAEAYGVKTVFPNLDYEISERAVFIVSKGEIVYREVMENPHNLPDLEKLKQELQKL